MKIKKFLKVVLPLQISIDVQLYEELLLQLLTQASDSQLLKYYIL